MEAAAQMVKDCAVCAIAIDVGRAFCPWYNGIFLLSRLLAKVSFC
jgi:hypothetical protein